MSRRILLVDNGQVLEMVKQRFAEDVVETIDTHTYDRIWNRLDKSCAALMVVWIAQVIYAFEDDRAVEIYRLHKSLVKSQILFGWTICLVNDTDGSTLNAWIRILRSRVCRLDANRLLEVLEIRDQPLWVGQVVVQAEQNLSSFWVFGSDQSLVFPRQSIHIIKSLELSEYPLHLPMDPLSQTLVSSSIQETQLVRSLFPHFHALLLAKCDNIYLLLRNSEGFQFQIHILIPTRFTNWACDLMFLSPPSSGNSETPYIQYAQQIETKRTAGETHCPKPQPVQPGLDVSERNRKRLRRCLLLSLKRRGHTRLSSGFVHIWKALSLLVHGALDKDLDRMVFDDKQLFSIVESNMALLNM